MGDEYVDVYGNGQGDGEGAGGSGDEGTVIEAGMEVAIIPPVSSG